jgi:hypothetical protein
MIGRRREGWSDYTLGQRAAPWRGGRNVRFGSKQTFRSAIVMSALPPIADMGGATRDVRFGPIADMTSGVGGTVSPSALLTVNYKARAWAR